MFFVASKVLHHLVSPYTLLSILLIASVLIRHAVWKRRLFWAAFSMLLFFSNEFVANAVMYAWEVDTVPFDQVRARRAGIVLTGSTVPDLEPDDRVYFQRGADRVTHTVELYKRGLIQKIIVSGGTGSLQDNRVPEARLFRSAMVLMGVPEEDILIEDSTRNTAESPGAVKKILLKDGIDASECLLITSAFHMRRSLACYESNGLQVTAFSTDFYAHRPVFFIDDVLIPQLQAVQKWEKLMKEWVGLFMYKLAGYI